MEFVIVKIKYFQKSKYNYKPNSIFNKKNGCCILKIAHAHLCSSKKTVF